MIRFVCVRVEGLDSSPYGQLQSAARPRLLWELVLAT